MTPDEQDPAYIEAKREDAADAAEVKYLMDAVAIGDLPYEAVYTERGNLRPEVDYDRADALQQERDDLELDIEL